MKFKKSFLLELLDCSKGKAYKLGELEHGKPLEMYADTVTVVCHEEEGKSGRWSIAHSMVFQIGTKHFMAVYSVGATEQQDESPWEYAGDEIECMEVQAVPVTVIRWLPVA